jgi:hypothetical protein
LTTLWLLVGVAVAVDEALVVVREDTVQEPV